MTELSSDTIHATCIAIGGRALLLNGRSGAGKSDLALRLIDRGAVLVSDDYTHLHRRDGKLYASPPPTIAGKIEVRGVGIVEMPYLAEAQVVLLVDLEAQVMRMPAGGVRLFAGIAIQTASAVPFEMSAPIKVELLMKAIPA